MSFEAQIWAGEQNVTTAARLVLRELADAHNAETGRCDPGLDVLARATGYGKDTISAKIDVLAELQLLVRERRHWRANG